MSVLHLRFDGQSQDIELSQLDIGLESSDNDVKGQLSTYLDIPLRKLDNYVIDRDSQTNNITVRPNAVFGLI